MWLSVSTLAPKAAQSIRSNAERARAVLETLKSLVGSEDRVSTLGYSLSPQYRHDKEDGKREPIGYRAVNTIVVETKHLSRVGDIIDAAVRAGANRVENIRFAAEDDLSARKEAIKRAIKDAVERAEAVAEASGVEIVRISHIWVGRPEPPVIAGEYRALGEGAPPTPIEPWRYYRGGDRKDEIRDKMNQWRGIMRDPTTLPDDPPNHLNQCALSSP